MFSKKIQWDSKKDALIRNMLKPCLEKFQDMRVMQMKKDINQCICELKANKMNLLALDEPKQRFCRQFTGTVRTSADELIVEINDILVQQREIFSKRQSIIDSEKYTEKIVAKIFEKLPGSEVVSLSLDGNLWRQSTLNVTIASGECFQFVTKTIVNQTLFGHRFYQFPTRIHKERN